MLLCYINFTLNKCFFVLVSKSQFVAESFGAFEMKKKTKKKPNKYYLRTYDTNKDSNLLTAYRFILIQNLHSSVFKVDALFLL